jgi:hypothetical protein
MMNVTEARDLVERCFGRAVAADQVQPRTGFMELYRCLGLEVQSSYWLSELSCRATRQMSIRNSCVTRPNQ